MNEWADVLIVEDERKLRYFATEVFRLEGISAAAVADGCQAMQFFEDALAHQSKLPRIVLLDLTMPCLSGYEVYKQIAAAPWCGSITVVITSAAGDKFDTLPGPAQTLQLMKPYEVRQLVEMLRNVAPDLFAA
jgi:two-component system phosphate regulon response regulator PhoB